MSYAALVADNYMHRNDFNCAETMLHAANEAYGLGLSDRALRAASAFGGGMGVESTCGALTGALMAIGCARATTVCHQDTEFQTLRNELVERFRDRFGSLECRHIKPEFRHEQRGCAPVVEATAEIVEELLERRTP